MSHEDALEIRLAADMHDVSDVEFAVMEHLVSLTYPSGARLAQRHLTERGFTVSEASISRLLAQFDERGWTEKVGEKGRTLTPFGRRLLKAITDGRRRDEGYSKALDINDIEQVVNLLRARRAVESEGAAGAARNITADDLRELEQLLVDQRRQLGAGLSGRSCAMSFHRAIARQSRNPLLLTMSETVLSEDLDYLEHVLDLITVGLPSYGSEVDDHEKIIDALKTHDEAGAAEAMHAHLSRLIDKVESFMTNEKAPMFNSILGLALGT